MKFSILIPSTPSRLYRRESLKLLATLETQVARCPCPDEVEILMFTDNKKRSIGAKRDALLQIARGDYVAFVDDDDFVTTEYVKRIVQAIDNPLKPDVITFKQMSSIDGHPFCVDFGLSHDNEPAECDKQRNYKNIKRKPWHVCAWRHELVAPFHFPDTSYGEDWGWVSQFVGLAKTEVKIDEVLHCYYFSTKASEAANGTT